MPTMRKSSIKLLLFASALAMVTLACSLQDLFDRVDFPEGFEVNKTADTNDGACTLEDCSLREAIIAANEQPGPDTVIVPAGVYVLALHGEDEDAAASGDLDITESLTIKGAGQNETVIDGDFSDRVFDINNYAQTLPQPVTEVEMTGITIQNGQIGNSPEFPGGGGIFIGWRGKLILTRVTVQDNLAASGAGIYSTSREVIFNNVLLRRNQAENGGGIYNRDGMVTINDSEITANSADFGGAIYNHDSSFLPGSENVIQINDTTLLENTATEFGGGIYNGNDSILILLNSEILGGSGTTNARRGGGIYNVGDLFMTLTTVGGNVAERGAGIFIGFSGTAKMKFMFVTDNHATEAGGGIDGGGVEIIAGAIWNNTAPIGAGINASISSNQRVYSFDITNTTITGNLAAEKGGGIALGSAVRLNNVTLSFNSAAEGGGIFNRINPLNDHSNPAVLSNTIVSSNNGGNCVGPITSEGNNLENTNTCGFSVAADLINTDPLLDGPAMIDLGYVLPLLADSPSIDMGFLCPNQDGRGLTRPQDGDLDGIARCDIGAYELEAELGQMPFVILTETSEPAVPPEFEAPTVTTDQNTNCRSGPDTVYPAVEILFKDEIGQVKGRNTAETWFYILLPDSVTNCWVWDGVVTQLGDFTGLRVIPDPPRPTATSTQIPIPTATQMPDPTAAPLGSITAVVWKDDNGDSSQQGGEGGLSNATVHLGQGACTSSGFKSANTNSNGTANFSGLAGGAYCLSVNIAESCGEYSVATTSTQYTINLDPGDSVAHSFGYQKKIC